MISLSARLTLILPEWSWPLFGRILGHQETLGVDEEEGWECPPCPGFACACMCLCIGVFECRCAILWVWVWVCVCVRACVGGGTRNAWDHPGCFGFPLHGEREGNPLRIPPLEVFSCHKPPFNRQNPNMGSIQPDGITAWFGEGRRFNLPPVANLCLKGNLQGSQTGIGGPTKCVFNPLSASNETLYHIAAHWGGFVKLGVEL